MSENGSTPELTPEAKRALLGHLLQERAGAASGESDVLGPSNGGISSEEPPFGRFVNPPLFRLLRSFDMDREFVKGEGCWLFDSAGSRYLDFTAAYGALPFGFNHPEIWTAVHALEAAGEPSFVQPSVLGAAGELAERLVDRAPGALRYVAFVNSGAESVEVAIKLARMSTGRLPILSTENGFHGKTLGALSATGRAAYQRGFGAPVEGFLHVPYGDITALNRAFSEEPSTYAAFIVEPIQGEGGVVTPPPGYLAAARELCTRHGSRLILDEVQTGLGRTGQMFACEDEGVEPDIMTLAKALGGGLVPIGAVLYTSNCLTEDFALKHSSTFANNSLSCRVALRSLELLTRDEEAMVRRVRENGAYLVERLRDLQRQYPGIITAVRGRGYLVGLEFTAEIGSFGRQCLMASMAAQGTLVAALCSHLLNVEKVRLTPTMFGTRVLRIEPPLIATREMCDTFVGALNRALGTLQACDTARFLGHLVGRHPVGAVNTPVPTRCLPRPPEPDSGGRWAFIMHALDGNSYADFDEALVGFDEAEMGQLVRRLNDAPLVDTSSTLLVGPINAVSSQGREAYGELFAIPHTAAALLEMPSAQAVGLVREAVQMAAARGARIVGLGAYTSVVTKNGAYLEDLQIPVTTGNSYTVVAAVESVQRIARELGRPLSEMAVVVLGSAGSIGGAVSLALARHVSRLTLLGNPRYEARSLKRLDAVVERIVGDLLESPARQETVSLGTIADVVRMLGAQSGSNGPDQAARIARELKNRGLVTASVDADDHLRRANLIVTATSNIEHLLTPTNVGPGAIVYDVSRPSNVHPDVRAYRPDVTVIDGGLISVPSGTEMAASFGLAPGLVYACMAETVLLALERRYDSASLGDSLSLPFIEDMRRLGEKHGFRADINGMDRGARAPRDPWRSRRHGGAPRDWTESAP